MIETATPKEIQALIDERERELYTIGYRSYRPGDAQRMEALKHEIQALRYSLPPTGMAAGSLYVGGVLGAEPSRPVRVDESRADDNPYRKFAREMGQDTSPYDD